MKPFRVISVWFILTLIYCEAAFAESADILTNLLIKARSLNSYHLKWVAVGTLDTNRGYIAKMEIKGNGEVWARRTNESTKFCAAGRSVLKPIEHPEYAYTFTNLTIFDGKTYHTINSQNGNLDAIQLQDPKKTCKMISDAETILMELMKDTKAQYIGRKKVNYASCQIFESSSHYFSLLLSATDVNVEVAVDEETGLPVRISFKTKDSSSSWDFEKAEINPKIDESRFQPPTEVKFQDAEPDGLGGFSIKQ